MIGGHPKFLSRRILLVIVRYVDIGGESVEAILRTISSETIDAQIEFFCGSKVVPVVEQTLYVSRLPSATL